MDSTRTARTARDALDRIEMQVVIADAAPLIALARIGQLQLLPQLFAHVAVTETVSKSESDSNSFSKTHPI